MSTTKEAAEYILEKLGYPKRFATRAMFGEYALYADGKVVALICNDQLYVKILPESEALEEVCEKDTPFPTARPHYLVEEYQLDQIEELSDILLAMAKVLPKPKKKKRKNLRS